MAVSSAAGSAAVRPQRRGGRGGRTPTAHTSAQLEPSSSVCHPPVHSPGCWTPRRTRVRPSAAIADGRCAARVSDTRCPHSGRRTGRCHRHNNQRTWPSRLRQKGRSGSAQAAVMAPVAGHLTAAGPLLLDTSSARRTTWPHTGQDAGSSGRSIRRSLVTTSSTLPQGRPCGRPPAAAVLAPAATRRPPGSRPHRQAW